VDAERHTKRLQALAGSAQLFAEATTDLHRLLGLLEGDQLVWVYRIVRPRHGRGGSKVGGFVLPERRSIG